MPSCHPPSSGGRLPVCESLEYINKIGKNDNFKEKDI
jgi:hypothetical protein